MSAIMKAVLKACDIDEQGKDESRQDFLKRVMRGINKLDDKDYDKLMGDKDVSDWFNAAADVAEANKKNDKSDPLPDFPDMPKDEPTTRRRRGGDDDEKPTGKGRTEKVEPSVVKAGMVVTITTKRGKVYKDVEVVEKGKDFIAFKEGKEEVEVDLDRIDMIEVFNDGVAKGGDEPEGPKEPAVGDVVELTTKRGKTVKGEVVEITDDEIVLKTEEGEEEYRRERIESIKVAGASSGRRRSSSSDDKGSKGGEEKPERSRASNGGISVGQRIRELIVDNMDASQEDIVKMLTKEKLEFRENTVKLTWVETHKLLTLLKERKLLK